jgi:hypothetical protein
VRERDREMQPWVPGIGIMDTRPDIDGMRMVRLERGVIVQDGDRMRRIGPGNIPQRHNFATGVVTRMRKCPILKEGVVSCAECGILRAPDQVSLCPSRCP